MSDDFEPPPFLDTDPPHWVARSLAWLLIVLFTIGVLVDVLVFGFAERKIRKRYGLVDAAAA